MNSNDTMYQGLDDHDASKQIVEFVGLDFGQLGHESYLGLPLSLCNCVFDQCQPLKMKADHRASDLLASSTA
jgi:hypothetical protein